MTFEAGATFGGAPFEDDVDLSNSEFAGGCAEFSDARFKRRCVAVESKFRIAAAFAHALFARTARFGTACFDDRADFRDAMFGDAFFPTTAFKQHAIFSAVTSASVAGFRKARFNSGANFTDLHVGAESHFSLVYFEGEATLSAHDWKEEPRLRLLALTIPQILAVLISAGLRGLPFKVAKAMLRFREQSLKRRCSLVMSSRIRFPSSNCRWISKAQRCPAM